MVKMLRIVFCWIPLITHFNENLPFWKTSAILDLLSFFKHARWDNFKHKKRNCTRKIIRKCKVMRQWTKMNLHSLCLTWLDNSYHNMDTLDGQGTIHAMEGIRCITPSKVVRATDAVKRYHLLPTAKLRSLCSVELHYS